MSINTSVYGAKENWSIVGTQYESGSEDNFYLADFGTDGEYDHSTLKAGIDNGKIALNEPIDKTVGWCGLGDKSTFSNIEYYNRKTGDNFQMFNKDERTVTNFALFQRMTTWALASPLVGTWYYADTSNTKNGSRARWSPDALNGTTSSDSNFNLGLKPFAQIPVKNCVLVPVVHVKSTVTDVSSSTVRKAYLWDYLNENNSVNFNSHPYILNVGFQMWGKNTGDEGTRSNRIINSFIAVTDEITAGEGQPVDVSVPAVLQGKSTHYYAFGKNYGTYQSDPSEFFTVMGLISGNTNFMAIPSSNSIIRQAGASMVLPHPNGIMSEPVSGNRIYYIEYYSGLQEWIREQLACFGLFFTDDRATAESGALDSENMFLGILDGNNIGNGQYSSGSRNRDQKQWAWSSTNNSDYSPDIKPDIDPNTYENTSGFNSVLNAPEGFNKRYVLSATDVRQLNTDFFKALQSKPDDIDYINYSMSEFLTNDPISAIVSLKWFPFTVPSYGNATPIKLGNYQTTVSAPYYTGSGVEVYNLGSFELHPHYGKSFLDYEPYSKTSVVIPYCGTVQLDHSIYMGTTVSIHLIVDIYTGACTAQIKSDGLVVDSISGVCSVDLPISGIDNATLEGQIYNASLNLKSSKITEGTTVVAGGLSVGSSALGLLSGSQAKRIKSGLDTASALNSAIEGVNQSTKNLSQSKFDLSHVQIPFKSVGAQTGLSNAKFEQFCRVLLYRPVFLNGAQDLATWYDTAEAQNYAKTVGYATVKSGTLGSFTGFTVCSNADLSGIPATDTEKEQILNLLKSGVYM